MDRHDAEKVIKALSEKPFICGDLRIEVPGGYVITTKAHLDKLEAMETKRKGTTRP